MGDTISLDRKGESCLFHGRVLDLDGNPIAVVVIDVWSENAHGYYDVQQPNIQPKWNNRSIKSVSYPIPDDGPVGRMLDHLGRHPYRPAHIHYLITKQGWKTLITRTFVDNDEYLTDDAVFAVKDALVAPYEPVSGGPTLWQSRLDFILVPQLT